MTVKRRKNGAKTARSGVGVNWFKLDTAAWFVLDTSWHDAYAAALFVDETNEGFGGAKSDEGCAGVPFAWNTKTGASGTTRGRETW